MAAVNNRISNGAIYFDTATIATYAATTLPYGGMLGMFVNKDNKKYQLVLVDSGSNALAANDVVVWLDLDDYTVTNDVSDLSATAAVVSNNPAGVALGTVAAGSYCFIQVRGIATVRTNQDDDIAAGDTIIADDNEDGQCESVAGGTASTYVPLGIALAADVDADDTVSVRLTVPLNGD